MIQAFEWESCLEQWVVLLEDRVSSSDFIALITFCSSLTKFQAGLNPALYIPLYGMPRRSSGMFDCRSRGPGFDSRVGPVTFSA